MIRGEIENGINWKMGTVSNNGTNPTEYKLGNNLKVLEQNDQIKELQTIIRDRWVMNGECAQKLHAMTFSTTPQLIDSIIIFIIAKTIKKEHIAKRF